MEQDMTFIAIYLFFIASLSGYRASRYWPKEFISISWLKNNWWHIGGTVAGSILFIYEKGITVGLLSALCTYMALAACIVFFTNCNKLMRIVVLLSFHTIVVGCFILNFYNAC